MISYHEKDLSDRIRVKYSNHSKHTKPHNATTAWRISVARQQST